MDKYDQLSIVGEGSYGVVLKCRHKETSQLVAIKKFLETEEDITIRKMALREIRMLKRLRHENLITMIEVFRHRKRYYIVFEYMEGTVLDELEKMPHGLGEEASRERIFQVARAINYCHHNNIIHRDVKPENVLISALGVVKLCDFGFARVVMPTGGGHIEPCTEYVATRWYRAPELLVGENQYHAPVDIWAMGCLFAEMMSGEPLFPGDSDIDQLYLIVKTIGKPCYRHQQLLSKNTQLRNVVRSAMTASMEQTQAPALAFQSTDATSSSSSSSTNLNKSTLRKHFSRWTSHAINLIEACLKMDPHSRIGSDEFLRSSFFQHDRFPSRFLPQLRERVLTEMNANPLLRKFKNQLFIGASEKKPALVDGTEICPPMLRRVQRLIQAPGSKVKTIDANAVHIPSLQPHLDMDQLRLPLDNLTTMENASSESADPSPDSGQSTSTLKNSDNTPSNSNSMSTIPTVTANTSNCSIINEKRDSHMTPLHVAAPTKQPLDTEDKKSLATPSLSELNALSQHPNRSPVKHKSLTTFFNNANFCATSISKTSLQPLPLNRTTGYGMDGITETNALQDKFHTTYVDKGHCSHKTSVANAPTYHLEIQYSGDNALLGNAAHLSKSNSKLLKKQAKELLPIKKDVELFLPVLPTGPSKVFQRRRYHCNVRQIDNGVTVTPDFRYKKAKRKLHILDISLPAMVKANE